MPLILNRLTARHLFLFVWISASILIAVALYMQYVMGLLPCALCMTQRVFVIATGVMALLAWLHNPRIYGIRVYAVLGALMAVIGSAFSIRHLWLQNLPEELAPACGPSLSYLFESFPLTEALSILLQGDGNCAVVEWSLFGITIPGWTLIAFIGLLCINTVIFCRTLQR